MATKRVRVAELKAHLSAYLKRASKGEHITVFDRDTPIAELGPASKAEGDPFKALAAHGAVRLGSQNFAQLRFTAPPSPIDAQGLLRAVRED